MLLTLTNEQIERIIEKLSEGKKDRKDEYIISYLQYVKQNQTPQLAINYDEIPF